MGEKKKSTPKAKAEKKTETKKKKKTAPKAKVKAKNVESTETPVVETTEFMAFCGSSYDPDPQSECQLSCLKDMPDEHKKCHEYFLINGSSMQEKAAHAAKRVAKTKDYLGYRNGTRASGINQLLCEGATISEMTEHFDSTDNATRTHMYVLKSKHNKEIFKIPGLNRFIFDDPDLISSSLSIGCIDNPVAHGKIVQPKEDYTVPEDVMKLFV